MIAVIGCGNPTRSDDGLGPAVIAALKARGGIVTSNVKLLDAGTDGIAAMFAARGCRALIVIDACGSGAAPGSLFEVPGSELERDYEPTLNLHDFRWDHALAAGRRMFREDFPTDVVVLMVEVQTIAFGLGLSTPVAAASERVVARVAALIEMRQTAAAAE